ncbi:MAG: NFACT family protein [Clostridiales Family XIII bacterium]|jgi:predicted ribosome quality control (RQC) complex YloA/Tae2 family protein|nr:NFACT family protein [Clostridiales Family XIII bacterium]
MPFDGIVLSAVASRLSALLTDGRIDKIYQPEADELLLHIARGREKHRLFLSSNSANPRVCLVRDYGPYPQNPPAFCMLLRKHIQGGRIACIAQKGTERILECTVYTVNELGFSKNKRLTVEIMGKHSNILLLDEQSGHIIDSIKRLSPEVNRYRQTLPGCPYIEPPSHGKLPWYAVERAHIAAALADGGGLKRAAEDGSGVERAAKAILSLAQGIGPRAADELAAEAFADMRARRENLSEKTLADAILRALKRLADQSRAGRFAPVVYLDRDGKPLDFHAFPLAALESACEAMRFDDINAAVGYYYENRIASNRVRQKSADLLRAAQNSLDKQLLKKQRLLEDLTQAENADKDRLFGELLTANLHTLQTGQRTAILTNYYDGGTVEIPLDPRISPSQNAQRYYKLYGKAKTAVVEKTRRLAETDKEIAYLESVLSFIENAATPEETDALRLELIEAGCLRRRGKQGAAKKQPRPAPLSYTVHGGFRVEVGRNNRENDLLTFKKAAGGDLWLHTKDIPGAHVILFTEGREAPAPAVFEAAAIAAWHSKGRASENVPVDYALAKHVKKPAGARPGMVIFTHNRTLYVKPGLPPADSESAKPTPLSVP